MAEAQSGVPLFEKLRMISHKVEKAVQYVEYDVISDGHHEDSNTRFTESVGILEGEEGEEQEPDDPNLETERSSVNDDNEQSKKQSCFNKLKSLPVKKKCTLLFATSSALFTGVTFSLIGPIYPFEATRKGMSTTQTGVVYGLFGIVIFCTAPFFGSVLTKLGPKKTFITGIFVGGCCNILYGTLYYVPDGTPFIVTSILIRCADALGFAAYTTSSFAIVSGEFKENIGLTFGVLETGNGIGNMLGPIIGGALYDLAGFRCPFYVAGAFVLINSLLAYKFLPEVEDIPVKRKGSMLSLFRSPVVIVPMACLVLGEIGVSTFFSTFAKHAEQLDISVGMIGNLYGLVALLYSGTSILWGYISDTLDYQAPLIIGGQLVFGIGYLILGPSFLLPFIPFTMATACIGLVFIGISFGCVYIPTMKSMVKGATTELGYDNNIDTFGLVSGLFKSAQTLGAFLGPVAMGAVVQKYGYPIAYTVVGVIPLLMMFVCLVFFTLRYFKRRRNNCGTNAVEIEESTTTMFNQEVCCNADSNTRFTESAGILEEEKGEEEEEPDDTNLETEHSSINDDNVQSKKQSCFNKLKSLPVKKKCTLLFATSSALFTGVTFSLIGPIYPFEATRKGMSTALTGVVYGLFGIVIFCTAPFFGSVLTKLGPKKTFITGIFVGGCCNILYGTLYYVPDGTPFIVTSILIRCADALGFAAYTTSSFAIVSGEFKENIGLTFGVLETGNGIGNMLGPIIGGALYDLAGFRCPFYVAGAFVLINSLLAYKFLPEVEDIPVKRKGSMLSLFRSPVVIVPIVCLVLGEIGVSTFFSTFAKHAEQLDISVGMIGNLYGLVALLYSGTSILWGYISDTLDYQAPLIIGGQLVFGIGYLILGPSFLLPFIPFTMATACIGLVFIGISFGCVYIPTMKSMVKGATTELGYDNNIDTFGLVSGLFKSAQTFGAFLGPVAMGAVVQKYGYPIAYTVVGVIPLLMMFVCLVFFTLRYFKRRRNTSGTNAVEIEESTTMTFNQEVGCNADSNTRYTESVGILEEEKEEEKNAMSVNLRLINHKIEKNVQTVEYDVISYDYWCKPDDTNTETINTSITAVCTESKELQK